MPMKKRILLFTGKGGVGKTTCAAATAVRAAELGYKTLVLSSDPAHSLADALDRPLSPEPEEIFPNLYAQEVDLYYSMKKHWGNLRDVLLMAFKWQGINEVAAEELAAIPGMNEGTVLLWLEQAYREGDYDLIVVDSAPTGETLTLLTLPEVTQWWVARAFPFQKAAIKTLGFAVRKTTGIPLDKGYEELNHLFDKLKEIHEVLSDATLSTVRLVANPEKMVLEETRRAYTYLQLYGYAVDAVVVNRILPKEGIGPVLQKYVAAQDRYLDEIDARRTVLSDATLSTVRLVANPEKMVLEETRRAYTYLQLYGYAVDAVVVNRILPKEGIGPVLQKYVAAQDRYLDEIDASFSPLPILHVPHLGEEVFGVELLRKIGARIYEDRDPTEIFYNEPTYKVIADGEAYVLEIRLPLTEETAFTAQRFGDKLVIQIQNQRRNYLLPRFLTYYTLARSHIENGWLRVHFDPPEDET